MRRRRKRISLRGAINTAAEQATASVCPPEEWWREFHVCLIECGYRIANMRDVRRPGMALFPELKPLEFLQERRKLLTEASWQSLYQQHPIVVGGGIFPIEKIRTIPVLDRKEISRSVRYVDKAGTEGGDGAYTAMVLMHKMKDGRYIIEDVVRGHWSALERETKLKHIASLDKAKLKMGSYEVAHEIATEMGASSRRLAATFV